MATKKKSSKKSAASSKKVTPQRIMGFVWDFAKPLMVEAAIRNRVFDVLSEGPHTLEELVAATDASERGLKALLGALVGIGLVGRKGARYNLPPDAATFLVTTKPSFMGGVFLHASSQLVPHWLHLTEIVRTGKPVSHVNDSTDGSEFFAKFVEDIFNMSYAPAKTAAAALVKKAKKPVSVLDIAAGSGVWGIAMAHESPQVSVTAVDWPGVIPVTKRVAAKHEVADRFSYVEGDILKADLGKDHHVATLGHILHSEGAERSKQLLERVFAALAPGGTIVIAEFTPDEDRRGPSTQLIFGVNMLVNTDQGDVFTFGEIKSWLKETGYRKVRQLKAAGPSPLILADKPKPKATTTAPTASAP
jgi:3-hydroxy-5-methyl-1-naphthoate 3-O-methyltransferase